MEVPRPIRSFYLIFGNEKNTVLSNYMIPIYLLKFKESPKTPNTPNLFTFHSIQYSFCLSNRNLILLKNKFVFI